jgi:hypothetical protein
VINRDEIMRSLNGTWLLFLGKPGAMRFFDTSYQGFWRSFQAIVLIAPAYALTVVADRRALLSDAVADDAFNEAAYMTAKWLTLAVDWAALPLLLAGLGTFLGIRQGYMAYVVARNWSAVLLSLPFAAVGVLDLSGLVSGPLLFFPSLIALAIALRLSFVIAHRALGVGVDVAIGFVVLDFLVSLGVARLIGRLFGVESPI